MRPAKRIWTGVAAAFFALGALLFAVPGVRFSVMLFLGLGVLVLMGLALGWISEKYRFWRTVRFALSSKT